MIINGINFPKEILKSIHNGSLVVFAGAGVSIDSPTSLPDFIGLAKLIARQSGRIFNSKEDKVEEFLGDLQRDGIKVKELVAKNLEKGNPKPNKFHFNILNLFHDSNSVRIVTTNQDCMFEAAAKQEGLEIPVYNSPAVPYGDDFNGIVNLHGNVHDPRNIVITDADFGKAYMLNGYATKFVVDMLKQYTVLFIGYSYNDVILRYLTTSIPSNTFSHTFILCEEMGNERKIKRTGIESIIFTKDKYDAECCAIKKIGDLSKRGLTDWKVRVGGLNIAIPPIDEEQQDEILEGIQNYRVQKFLCERINGNAWVSWLDRKDVFSSLFDEEAKLNDNDLLWSRWLISNFISDEIINLIVKHDNKVNYKFCEKILMEFCSNKINLQDGLFEMYILLFQKKIHDEYVLCSVIQNAEKKGLLDCMWNLFSAAIDFDIILEKKYSVVTQSYEYRMLYKWRMKEYHFENLWNDYVLPHLSCYAYDALQLATGIITKLYYKFQSSDIKGDINEIDMVDIEGNGNHYYQDKGLLVLCNMIKQAFDEVYKKDELFSLHWINQTLKLKRPLLARLVLLILREDTQLMADVKINYVIENCNFHDIKIRDQIFRLVASVFDDIEEERRDSILDKIMTVDSFEMGFKDNERKGQMIAYLKYNWLVWLSSKCNKTNRIKDEISKIKMEFPYFKPRKRPDLIIGFTEFKRGGESPISKEGFLKMDAKTGYDYVLNFRESDSFIGSDRYGLLQTLSEVIGEDIQWAVGFIDKVENDANWDEEIWEYIFSGLNKSVEKKNDLNIVLNHFTECVFKEKTFLVAQFLFNSLEKEDIYYNLSKRLRNRLIQISRKLWLYRQYRKTNEENWVFWALNDTTGILTNIMMKIICLDSIESGIPSWFINFVKKNIPQSGNIEEFICVISEYANELFARNEQWTKDNVLIYLSCNNLDYVQAAWEGLITGLYDFNLAFSKTILPAFCGNITVGRKLDDDLNKKFIYDYTMLLIYFDDDPLESNIAKFIKGSTKFDKQQFAFSIYRILGNMTKEQRTELWNRWLKEYWDLRIHNIPEKLCAEELEQMLNWILLIPNKYEEIVDLLLRSECDKLNSYSLIRDLNNSKVVDKYPQKTGELLIYLLQHNGELWLDKQVIIDLIEKLKKKGVINNTIQMLDELIQKI